MTLAQDDIVAWMARWAEAIRNLDYDTGRELFAGDVVAFGTWTGAMRGIDDLVADQWMQVWPHTRGFEFIDPVVVAQVQDLAAVATEWRSEGKSAEGWFERQGRATLVLVRAEGDIACVHSHFSLVPGTDSQGRHSI